MNGRCAAARGTDERFQDGPFGPSGPCEGPSYGIRTFKQSTAWLIRYAPRSESTIINAPAERVYAIIADYRDGHPRILPHPPFHDFELESGGIGAGTIIRFKMTTLGKTQTFRGAVTEPEPGRVLVETYFDTQTVTTFTVDPCGDGTQSRVTFTTDLATRGGLVGIVERAFATWILRRTYRRELKLLARVVNEKRG